MLSDVLSVAIPQRVRINLGNFIEQMQQSDELTTHNGLYDAFANLINILPYTTPDYPEYNRLDPFRKLETQNAVSMLI